MNSSQYRELKGLLNTIQETLDGKGRELGLKQELRELRHYVEGRPPKYEDGINFALRMLGANHDKLRDEFDEHVDQQGKDEANRSGRWKGAYTVYAVIAGFLTLVGLGFGFLNAIRQSITQAMGGG